jgi:hypothetical protein
MKTTVCVPPRGTFKGANFVTPALIEYRQGTYDGKPVFIEISKENPPYFPGRSAPMYGVTFRRPGGGELWRESHDPSTSCESYEEALSYLESLP